MIVLAGLLLRTGGWLRPLLVAACTAVVTALVLVAVAMAMLSGRPDELLFDVVADPGTRGGAAFGTVLLTVPLALLLHQALRLGNAARQRRLAGLRLAGATTREVRLLGAAEVAAPAFVGAVAGVLLFGVLRVLLGGGQGGAFLAIGGTSHSVGLVPTSVTPPWWAVLLVVLAVTLVGLVLGLRSGREVALSPHGVSRHQRARPPRPWGALLLVAAAAIVPLAVTRSGLVAASLAAITLAVLGLMTLAPWSAYALGRLAQKRVTNVAGLLAAQRLVTEPRPAGRAGAAVGGIGLVAGGLGGLFGDLFASGTLEFFYVFSVVLVALCLLGTLLVVSLTLAVHSAESLTDRRRSMSSLYALGVPAEEIRSSQLWEGGLVAVPMSLFGALVGALVMGVLSGGGIMSLLLAIAGVVVTPLLALAAVWLAVALTAPVARRAIDPENLRTA
ncbi:MAG: FtsX-like permease family protein [Marmoricola sp.]|nr:FtsX-like permease family protein [Marmoricola sp.]